MKFHHFLWTTAVACGLAFPLASDAIAEPLAQGWTDENRRDWYRATQGSRLLPFKWFAALEQPRSSALFSDIEHLTSFGFVAERLDDDRALPVGFAIDKQDDSDFTISKLRWVDGQKNDEEWLGLNCSACHTADVHFDGEPTRIDGGPSLVDFQSFVEALDAALLATRADPEKYERFASRILGTNDTPANRDRLSGALDELIAWQQRTEEINETPMRYGFGRLDAFGHIYNKVLMFANPDGTKGNPSDAPVSYPFLWNIHRQQFVQWNGIAENSRLGDIEYGALGRNTGEVLGVFGDLAVTEATGLIDRLSGYESSVNTTNLDRLERLLHKLEAPKWPDRFPPIDAALAEKGETVFKEAKCGACHKPADAPEPTEVMLQFSKTDPINQTDIWMACNAFSYDGETGTMKGTRDGYVTGDPFGDKAPTATMLSSAVKGTLMGTKRTIVKEAGLTFFGIERPPIVIDDPAFESGALSSSAMREALRRSARSEACLSTDHRLLAYKARPLDGIWATAPYLHNGSVPTLYDLLRPAKDRPKRFWVGSREFDANRVGYLSDEPAGALAFEFQTHDADGFPIEGNSNEGHDYGAADFSDGDREALVEYLKTL